MSEIQLDVTRCIGNLITISFKIGSPVSQLNLIREKILVRGFQPFDKSDIMNELGRLQHIVGELHAEMLRIDDQLN